LTPHGIYREGTIIAKQGFKKFVFNMRWRVLKGEEFFINGQVVFPTSSKKDQYHTADSFYRSRFGPCAAHTGRVLAVCNQNQTHGVSRLTNCRRPNSDDPLGYETLMLNRQRKFCRRPDVIAFFTAIFLGSTDGYHGRYQEMRQHIADKHPKRALRMRTLQEVDEGAGTSLGDRLFMRAVTVKCKADEVAKYNKDIRVVSDFGAPACLLGYVLCNMMKHWYDAHPLTHRDGYIEFVGGPQPRRLETAFERLIDPSTRVVCLLFSDDSCLGIRAPDGTIAWYNVDIAGCDGSHRKPLFDLILAATPRDAHEDMKVLIEQCKQPIKVFDVYRLKHEKRQFVKLVNKEPVLLSGSSLTTITNNFATTACAYATIEAGSHDPEVITRAIASTGYEVTGVSNQERCRTYHDIQFLKHSPCRDTNGKIRAVLNVGVLLRSLGQCKGDLPGRGDLYARAVRFHHAYLAGCYPEASFTLLDILRGVSPPVAVTEEYRREAAKLLPYVATSSTDEERQSYRISDAEIYQRYQLRPCEIEEMHALFREARHGTTVSCPAITRILHIDYGYPA